MKASKVLKQYATGERNFQHVNLRGQSFKGKNLSGADFSEADLRGTNFTGANLFRANFTGVKCGLQKRWATFLVIFSWLLAGISAYSSIFVVIFLQIFNSEKASLIAGWIGLLILVIFLIVTIRQGAGIVAILVAIAGALSVVGAIAIIIGVSLVNEEVIAALVILVGVGTGAGAISVAIVLGFGAGIVAIALAGASVLAIALSVAGAGALSVGTGAGAVALSVAVALAVVVARVGVNVLTLAVASVGALAVAGAGAYVGWRSIRGEGDERDAWVRSFAIVFAAMGGTSFQNAKLIDADFTRASLKSTDFREANLILTDWRNTQKLDRSRPGKTYLKNASLRQLLSTGMGQNHNFDHQDFRNLNLRGVNLENASLIDTNFFQANLQEANLSRTRLVRANFERADLRGANLTGSCIQDWVITESTKLDGIICRYVFLNWISKIENGVDKGDKLDQMPPRGKFEEGGFVTFVRYILETVELYYEKDINPRLALTVLQKMSRDYDEPFDIVALGKKGERVFIQVKVSENIARENFKDDYYYRYDKGLKLWSGNNHQLPLAVDSFIEKKISEIASENTDEFVLVDATYVEGNYIEINQGEVNMSGDRDIQAGRDYRETHVNDQGIYVEGDYHNNPEQKQNLAQAAVEIQQLLEQLSKTYPTSTSREKNIVVGEAVDQIENNLTLKAKVINALKVGGTEAFKEAIDHPLVNILVATIEGWQDAE